jgi:hypothetical protein
MGAVEVRLAHEALSVARHFRSGAYGTWEGEGADFHAALDAAIKEFGGSLPRFLS